MTTSCKLNWGFRLFAGLLLILVIIVFANYYLNLGWLGRYARGAVAVTILLGLLFKVAAEKQRRCDNNGLKSPDSTPFK